jgi:hypothetical protein
MLDAGAATSSIKTLRKRFLKAVGQTAGLERLQGTAEKLIGCDALVKEMDASRKDLDKRWGEWLKWPRVPLPSGGRGLSRLDAVKKLWVLAKDARVCCDAFQARVAEHQRALSAQKVASKRPAKLRAAAPPLRDGARGVRAKAPHGKLSGAKRSRANVEGEEEEVEGREGEEVEGTEEGGEGEERSSLGSSPTEGGSRVDDSEERGFVRRSKKARKKAPAKKMAPAKKAPDKGNKKAKRSG